MSWRKRKKSSEYLTQDLRDNINNNNSNNKFDLFPKKSQSGPSVEPSTDGPSLFRNGLQGRVAVKKPFLWKGNNEKRLRYAKWHKEWTENQWQQVWWRDESSPEPIPQNFWSSVGSSWQRTEQKAANIQRRALGCPSGRLENYSRRLLKEITESLSKRVQAVLENKWAQTKYWRSSLLELYKVCFCLIYCISIHVCTCFNKSLHIFPVLMAQYDS